MASEDHTAELHTSELDTAELDTAELHAAELQTAAFHAPAAPTSDAHPSVPRSDAHAPEVHAPEVHTLPFGGGWANQRRGDPRILSMHKTHAEAAFVGREIARRDGADHVIHGREGTIRERSPYRSQSTGTG
jgi:hypothetical protein